MSSGNNRELAENKLILLYVIDKINFSVSNHQITKIILENKFMNYFLLQQYLNELCTDKLLASEMSGNKTLYTITQSGKQTLEFFINLIPPGIKSRIDDSIPAIKKSIKNETLITADFYAESENEYTVVCKVDEDNFTIIDLKIAVGTKSDARVICDNWKINSQAIYSEIVDSLTKHREENGKHHIDVE